MRLLLDPHMSAAENMARDEALLAEGVPTVRLYGWRPAAVSLGRSQTEADVDLDAAREWGLDVVRRGTGGGAILHEESEVTYAVVLPLDFPGLPRDITGSFAFVSAGIVAALRSLGVPAEIESVPDNTRESLCYVRKQGTNVVVPRRVDVGVEGGRSPPARHVGVEGSRSPPARHVGVEGGRSPPVRKISGGAQRRNGAHFLQHGTVVVEPATERMARLFREDPERIGARVTSLAEEGVRVSREKLVEALVAGFGQTFGPLERV